MTSEKPSIYTLSKLANVAPSTVSKALNNSPEVSSEMRRNIQALATRMNFRPRTVRQHVTCLGVLIQHYRHDPLDFNNYLSGILEGVAEYCHDEGIAMNVMVGSADEWNRSDMVKELCRRDLDGVVVVRSNNDSEYLEALEKNNFPYYVVNGDAPDETKAVTCDFAHVGMLAGEYLRSLGHEKVGVIVEPSDSPAGCKRLEGFLSVYPRAAVVRSEDYPGMVGLQVGARGIDELLERQPGLTAVFATGLEPSLSMMHRLQERNIRVPQDISLLSCDDFPLMAYLTPALSSVSVPVKAVGALAARQVHRLIRKLTPVQPEKFVNLKGEIIARGSTAPAPGTEAFMKQNR